MLFTATEPADYLRDIQVRLAGGGLFANFVHCDASSRFGRDGLLACLGQPVEQAPKLAAVRRAVGL